MECLPLVGKEDLGVFLIKIFSIEEFSLITPSATLPNSSPKKELCLTGSAKRDFLRSAFKWGASIHLRSLLRLKLELQINWIDFRIFDLSSLGAFLATERRGLIAKSKFSCAL